MYEVSLWYRTYHVMKTCFLFVCFTEARFPSPSCPFFRAVHEVMSLSWTSFVTFDFPVNRLTFRTSQKRNVAYV